MTALFGLILFAGGFILGAVAVALLAAARVADEKWDEEKIQK